MASKYSMLAKVGADTSQFTRAMKKTRGQTQSFGKQMMKMGGMLAGAFSVNALISFGKEAINLYNIQAQAEAKLQTALGNNVKGFERLKKVASDLQGTTLFGDEATIEAMSFLAQMKMSESEIKKIMPLIQDFATAQNMDLAGAAKLVSKSFGSSTNAMSRYGIEISGAAKSSGRFSDLQKALNDQVGGQAAAAAATGTGAMTKLTNAWGDFAEVIGSKLTPALNGAAEASIPLLQNLSKVVSTENLKWWEKIMAVGLSFEMSGDMGNGLALMAKLSEDRANEFANSPANYPNIPEWYTSMMAEMARDAEAESAEIGRRAAQAFSGELMGGQKGLTAKLGKGLTSEFFGHKKQGAGKLNKVSESAMPMGVFSEELAAFEAYAIKMNGIAQGMAEGINSAFDNIAQGIINSLGIADSGMNAFLQNMAAMVTKLISILLSSALANAIAGATQSGTATGPAAVFTTPAFIATAVGGVLAAFGSIAMPALAEGGLAFGPTMAMIGDNPRANVDPEVIAPLSKLQGLSSGMGGTVEFIIAGDKLKGVLRKHDNRMAITG